MMVPTVHSNVPQDRAYANLIAQTKVVYDQLLLKRREQLIQEMIEQKEDFDRQVNNIAKKNETKGLEIGVRAQEVLNKMLQKGEAELKEQQMDYQQKLDKMIKEMENQYRQRKKWLMLYTICMHSYKSPLFHLHLLLLDLFFELSYRGAQTVLLNRTFYIRAFTLSFTLGTMCLFSTCGTTEDINELLCFMKNHF